MGSQRVAKTVKVRYVKFGPICESAPDLKLSNPVYCIQVVFDRGKEAISRDIMGLGVEKRGHGF